ncbi:hypothetical protein BDV12DRAFT_200969 [Aspergillus spectabilis]
MRNGARTVSVPLALCLEPIHLRCRSLHTFLPALNYKRELCCVEKLMNSRKKSRNEFLFQHSDTDGGVDTDRETYTKLVAFGAPIQPIIKHPVGLVGLLGLVSLVSRDLNTILNKTPENALWVRTWFGNSDDPEGQAAADAGYAKVYRHAIRNDYDFTEDDENDLIDERFMFADQEEFGPSSPHASSADIRDGIALATPGCLPWYALSAMMHCPDQLVTWSERRLVEPDERLDMMQSVMVVVADRKACEEGLVLMFALNHKGAVLPLRARTKAYWVELTLTAWLSDGAPMDAMGDGPDDDRELYMAEGDGWDYTPDSPE